MSPAAALEYVRSRRPRVLLAPSQWKVGKIVHLITRWNCILGPCILFQAAYLFDQGGFKVSELYHFSSFQAVQEYQQQRMASKVVYTSGDAVLITKADLEGYHSPCNDNSGKVLAVVPRMARTSPMMARLSCLFASLKVSGNCGPVMRQLTEARAC